jgi:SAM-dependent methyltransferase
VLYADLTDRTYLCAPGRWDVMRCAACRAAYLDPRPSESTVHLAYREHYTQAAGPSSAGEASALRRLLQALRNGYLNARYGYRAEPASRLGPLVVPLLGRRREQADELVRHLPAPAGRRRLLDVGCGEGTFLAEMQARGWEVQGIEPSAEGAAAARAHGVPVEQGTLAEVSLDPGSLDAITFRLAFEALPDPPAALEKCRRGLAPGGTLWIATPSLESLAHRRFGADWVFLDVPRSTILYTPSSLTRLLAAEGFPVQAVYPSRRAGWSFRLSAAIVRGRPPFRQPAELPARLALEARLADVRARARPALADMVVVVARRA